MAVADVYDAVRAKRCYKEPRSHEESCDIIVRGNGTQFDPDAAGSFMEIQDQIEIISRPLRE